MMADVIDAGWLIVGFAAANRNLQRPQSQNQPY